MTNTALPGAELIEQGLRDLAGGAETVGVAAGLAQRSETSRTRDHRAFHVPRCRAAPLPSAGDPIWGGSAYQIECADSPRRQLPTSGRVRELADVDAMLAHWLISRDAVRRMFAQMEPELYRFPAIDPPSFRGAVDAVFPP
jgi:hypothetical protein